MIDPKPVVVSSLALRFREKDGWSGDLLSSYLARGKINDGLVRRDFSGQDHYWALNSWASLDVDRLYKDGHVGDLLGRDQWGELKGLSDLEVLRERNW